MLNETVKTSNVPSAEATEELKRLSTPGLNDRRAFLKLGQNMDKAELGGRYMGYTELH